MGSMCLLPGAGLAALSATSTPRVLVGWAAPRDGQVSSHEEQHQRAIDMAVAEVNDGRGVLRDDACYIKIAGPTRRGGKPNPL